MDAHLKELALTMGVEPYSFNPYENANDDYAVLEWMRENQVIEHWRRFDLLACGSYYYQIGDYARACLKVLK